MNSDAPVPYWPAYLPAAAEPSNCWLTPHGEAALDTWLPDGPDPEWHRELEAEAGA